MRTALVLEGGAMRGMFTCGVIDVFMENGVAFDCAVGVSAGAAFGCNYKSNQPGRAIRYNKRFCRDKRFVGVRTFIKTGDLYGADFCYRIIPDELDVFDRETFKKHPMKFYVGAFDCVNGGTVYHDCVDASNSDFQWIRASASMPVLSQIVEVDGYKLQDGGIEDSIPYKFIEEKGCTRNVVILTQPSGYIKKSLKIVPAMKPFIHKYPNLIDGLKNRHIKYNEQVSYVEECERRGEALIIRPETSLKIGKMEKNPKELERVYQIGRETGKKYLETVKKYLEQ